MNANNLFANFSYAHWAPDELQDMTFDTAIHRLETLPSLEAAFVVFWKILENPDPDDTLGILDIHEVRRNNGQEANT